MLTLSKPEWAEEDLKLAPKNTLAETRAGSEKVMQLPPLDLGLKYLPANIRAAL